MTTRLSSALVLILLSCLHSFPHPPMPREAQLTSGPGGRVLTNSNVWSPDGEWVAYDTRSDPAGDVFDGPRIEMVNVRTRDVRVVYEARNGAKCGVVTWHPIDPSVVFILGPENPTPEWNYAATRRQGVLVDTQRLGVATNLDACDLIPPFTPGALRGGSHVHVWNAAGTHVSFTYEDQFLASLPPGHHDGNQRNVGVSVAGRPVRVPNSHPRNHDGTAFTVLVTRTTADPTPGSDEIRKAFEEAWIGTNGYIRPDGRRQRHALAFQGHVRTASGATIAEVFVADLPDDLTTRGDGPLPGTTTTRPCPPKGVVQRRLTFTANDPHAGIQGPRHWLRSSPDGARIGFLRRDADGIVQFWTVSPNGGAPLQVTRNPHSVASAFSWHPDGRQVAFVMDHSVCVTDVATGSTTRLTARTESAPRPEACVFSPDGKRIAFVRHINGSNHVCIVDVP